MGGVCLVFIVVYSKNAILIFTMHSLQVEHHILRICQVVCLDEALWP